MKVKVKDGTIHIPASVWEQAHLPEYGSYEVEAEHKQIIISAQPQKEPKSKVKSVKEMGFVGMWTDRSDMANSQEWGRKQRARWRKRIKISG